MKAFCCRYAAILAWLLLGLWAQPSLSLNSCRDIFAGIPSEFTEPLGRPYNPPINTFNPGMAVGFSGDLAQYPHLYLSKLGQYWVEKVGTEPFNIYQRFGFLEHVYLNPSLQYAVLVSQTNKLRIVKHERGLLGRQRNRHVNTIDLEAFESVFNGVYLLTDKFLVIETKGAQVRAPNQLVVISLETGGILFAADLNYTIRGALMNSDESKLWFTDGFNLRVVAQAQNRSWQEQSQDYKDQILFWAEKAKFKILNYEEQSVSLLYNFYSSDGINLFFIYKVGRKLVVARVNLLEQKVYSKKTTTFDSLIVDATQLLAIPHYKGEKHILQFSVRTMPRAVHEVTLDLSGE